VLEKFNNGDCGPFARRTEVVLSGHLREEFHMLQPSQPHTEPVRLGEFWLFTTRCGTP